MSAASLIAAKTADEAISLIRTTRNKLTRITALISAIRADAIQGQAMNIDTLADIAQHIGEDWGSHLDHQIEALQARLDAAGGEA